MLIAFFVNDMDREFPNYTTTVLAHQAVQRGHRVCYITPGDFVMLPDDSMQIHARMAPTKKHKSHTEFFKGLKAVGDKTTELVMSDVDVLWLRSDPALDAQSAPWAADAGILFGREAVKRGVLVLNDPSSLSLAVNKMYFQSFPDAVRAETLITKHAADVKEFTKKHGGECILKPLQGSGGSGVFKVDKTNLSNLNQMLEAITRDGYVIAQAYVPAAAKGDIRLFIMNGHPLAIGKKYAEDASSGVLAAKAGGMAAIGVARLDDRDLLVEAGADLVVPTLDDVAVPVLAEGRLEERRVAAELRQRHTSRPPSVWMLAYDGFDPARQGLREALCAVGNGYFVTRGAFPEAEADGVHYPGTYVAGLYNRATTEIAGRMIENEDLVNVPNWLSLAFRVAGGDWFDVGSAEVLEHRLELDLRQGALIRRLRFQDPDGRRTQVVQRRFVSMKDQHLAGLETTFVAENWSGAMQVRSGLDGQVVNAGVKRYRDLNGRHLAVVHAGEADPETIQLQVETNQSHVRVALAARTRLLRDGRAAQAERRMVSEPGLVAHELEVELEEGRPATVEKVVALYTSRDRAISESLLDARQAAQSAAGFAELLTRHAGEWSILWDRFDLELDSPNEWAETVLHLHIFHLLQTVSPHTVHLDVGVPARGWHGEAYRGHIFWDEMFIFPFFNLQRPVLAASLLGYRHVRLGAARRAAREAGYEGAMFPWQSGSNGREETQQLHLNPKSGRWLSDHSHLQRHVNIAIAYNVWQHYMVTGSIGFLRFVGAELLIEIARFWASMATWNTTEGRYEILGVMGPDEYHEAYPDADRPGLNNNTYTNVMVVWVLQRCLEALEDLPPHYRQEIVQELGIRDDELDRWRDITRKMKVVFHADGVLTQFEGYEDLLEFDWEGYRERYGDIARLDRLLEAEGDSTNRYQLAKQADVLMLLFLLSRSELLELLAGLGYQVSEEQLARTVDYYLERTSHGSTLSGVVSAWVLARYQPDEAWRFLQHALESDVADVQGGTTAEGIHLGAMAGTVDILLRCLAGLRPRGEVLRFDPALPPQVKQVRFSVHYRGHRVEVTMGEDRLEVGSRPGRALPIKVLVRDQTVELAPGARHEFPLKRRP